MGVPLRSPRLEQRQTGRYSGRRETVARARATRRRELLAVAVAHGQGRDRRRGHRDRRVHRDRVRQDPRRADAVGDRHIHRVRGVGGGRAASGRQGLKASDRPELPWP